MRRSTHSNMHLKIEYLLPRFLHQKWTPKIGQRDKCILGSCCHPGGVLVIHTVRRLPVKRLMPTFGIVERKIPA